MRGRTDTGATTLEYAGLVVLAALIIGALVASGLPRTIAGQTNATICRIFGGRNCGARTAPRAQASYAYQPATDGPAPSPRPCSRPTPQPSPSKPAPLTKPSCGTDEAGGQDPLLHTHAHNDYQNQHPLTDSLGHGVNSVEADVHVDKCGDLVLKHADLSSSEYENCDTKIDDKGKNGKNGDIRGTLKDQYVDPLLKRLAQNGGHVYPGSDQPFQLVVELKKEKPTKDCDQACVDKKLDQEYDQVIEQTQVLNEQYPGAVDVVLSGAVPDKAKNAPSWVKLDQQSSSCDPGSVPDAPNDRYAMLSRDWSSCKSEKQRQALIAKAHKNGYRVRFWDAPDDEKSWAQQQQDGVDLIGTGHLGRIDKYDHDHCYV